MRITGGEFKGKQIISKNQRDIHIRPTSGKVREAIFNLLAHGKFLNEVDWLTVENPSILEDRVVADLYCGTGILGLEAFSRGAGTIIFADQNDKSLKIAEKNVEEFRANDKCIFVRTDCDNLPTPPALIDILFMDPPYDRNLVSKTLKSIKHANWLRDNGVIIVEHSKKEEIEEIKGLKILDSRQYNNTVITILKNCN